MNANRCNDVALESKNPCRPPDLMLILMNRKKSRSSKCEICSMYMKILFGIHKLPSFLERVFHIFLLKVHCSRRNIIKL